MTKSINIHFGALADPIDEQLDLQGFDYDRKQVDRFQGQLNSIIHLRVSGLLTDSIADKVYTKLHKAIVKHVCEVNKLKLTGK